MKDFIYAKPKNLKELTSIRREKGDDCLILAGGTNLYVYLKDRLFTAGTITDISGLAELKGIRKNDGYLEIGSCETISSLLESEVVVRELPMFSEALKAFANPLVRNMATIGGNIADASPIADTAPSLLVLLAEAVLAGTSGTRTVPLDEFFLGPRKTVMKSDEVLTMIRIPLPKKGNGRFTKLGLRKGTSCSVTSVAVWLETDDKVISDIRIAMGGVAAVPLRVRKTEERLKGAKLDVAGIRALAANLAQEIKPITDVRGSADYRMGVSINMLARTVASVAGLEE